MKKHLIKKIAAVLMTVLLLVILLQAAAMPAPASAFASTGPENIILTLTGKPGEMAVTWWDTPGVRPIVEYGKVGGFRTSLAAVELSNHGNFSVYSATMISLDSGAMYNYRITGMGAPAVFIAPTTGVGDFSFLFLGDVQNLPSRPTEFEAWGNLITAAFAANPGIKFATIAGDLVEYSDVAHWEPFLNQAQKVFSKIPLMPVPGNHE